MKHGLIPKKTKYEPNNEFKAVYFWNSVDLPKSLCCYDEIIIEATIPEGTRIDELWNGAWEVSERLVYTKIPPSNLKVIQYGENQEVNL